MAFAERQTNKPLKKATGKGAMESAMAVDDDFFGDKENNLPSSEAAKPSKKKTVEETYQKLTQLEHVLLRPDTYIGSTEMNRTKLWVYDEEIGLNQREVTYVPGLYKIFDEILVNAADNKQRDKNMDTLKVVIDAENNSISVWNNGRGIPVEIHKEEKCWVPELIFGHLLTSSNYNDNEKKTTGGRNGYGAKLANIFSTEFTVETADGSRTGKKFKQTFTDNMQSKGQAKVKECKEGENWTCITFKPDLGKFGMAALDADMVALMRRRVHDVAGTTPGVKVWLDDRRLKIKNFEDYCALFLAAAGRERDDDGAGGGGGPPRHVHLKANDRWEIVVAVSEGQFQQLSFVNGIATTRGGSHVNHVADQVATLLLEHLAKKHKGLKLKPFQVKGHLWLFVNALIENPAFDSQTKETLTLKPSAFGSKAELDDKFLKRLLAGTGVLESILNFGQEKQEKDMKKTDGKKTGRISGIPKLEDANEAGSRTARECTLILTEGDSAKALAVSGLAVVGRNRYGVFPLRGKVANPRDANHEQIMKNEEIKNLKTILGLQQGNRYPDGPAGLRYGHVMIMADQDPDGSHIKGLLINLFHYYWPNLLRFPGFLKEFATPIVKARRRAPGRQGGAAAEVSFFTLQEYEEWREAQAGALHLWSIKYYKGLGTSSSQEAKEYFSNLALHQMDFAWEGADDGEIIDMVFSKKRADDRKRWLLQYRDDLYVDHNAAEVSYADFVNRELIHFSMMDNMRSIPSLVDGLKPGQRKILFACFKRKLRAEIKVAQLAGYVAEHSAYHHGEQSLAMTIVNMAQSFVGSNNINLLVGSGQFGTRLQGGADAASPRYIFTLLSGLTRAVFHESDDAILRYLDDDGQSIEPQWYVPVLPMILVNGGHGIGTGWSTDVPTFNPRDIVANLRRLLRGEPPQPMHPWFKGFKGAVELNVGKKGDVSYAISGVVTKTSATTLEITELPVNKWTQQYKEFLEGLLDSDGGKKEPFIRGYKEWHTDTTVHFEVTLSEAAMREAEDAGLMKRFQLTRNLTTTNMHLFNAEGRITKYDSPEAILREFFGLRLRCYGERKAHMTRELEAQLRTLDNKCRFIREVVAGDLRVSNRAKAAVVADLVARGYNPQPREARARSKTHADHDNEEDAEADGDGDKEAAGGGEKGGFDYLLNMPIMSLTLERVRQLQAERDGKAGELAALQAKSAEDLWDADLDDLMARYDVWEEEEAARAAGEGASKKQGKGKGKAGKVTSKAKAAKLRRKSWGGSASDDDDSDAMDDDDDFVAAKPKAAKQPAPAKRPAPAPAPARPAPPKKRDAKHTPDKAAMRPALAPAPPPALTDDIEEEEDGGGSLSLFERLNAKVQAAPPPPKAKPQAPPKAKAPAKKKAKADSDDGEDDAFMEDAMSALSVSAPPPAASSKPRRAAASKKPIVLDSDDDEEEAMAEEESEDDFAPDDDDSKPPPKSKPAAAAKPKAAPKRKKMLLDSDEEEEAAGEEEGSEEEFAPRKGKGSKPPPARKAPAAKAKAPPPPKNDSGSDGDFDVGGVSDDGQDASPVPASKAARRPTYGSKGAKTTTATKLTASTKGFAAAKEDKPKPAAKKAAAPAKKAPPKRKEESDSDDFMGDAMGKQGADDSEEEEGGAPRAAARPGRRAAAAKKTYKLEESEEEEEDSEVDLLDDDSGSEFEG